MFSFALEPESAAKFGCYPNTFRVPPTLPHREGTLRIDFLLNGRMPHTFARPGLRLGIPGDESWPAVGLRCDGRLLRMRRKRGAHGV